MVTGKANPSRPIANLTLAVTTPLNHCKRLTSSICPDSAFSGNGTPIQPKIGFRHHSAEAGSDFTRSLPQRFYPWSPTCYCKSFPRVSSPSQLALMRRTYEGERTGLVVMGQEYSYLPVTRSADGIVYLRVSVTDDANCVFSLSRDGKKFEAVGQGFKAKPGRCIGAKVGLFALAPEGATRRGHADYDWFRIELPEQSSPTRARAQ